MVSYTKKKNEALIVTIKIENNSFTIIILLG